MYPVIWRGTPTRHIGGGDGVVFGFTNRAGTNLPPLDHFKLTVAKRVNGSLTERVVTHDIPITVQNALRDGELRYVLAASFDPVAIRYDETLDRGSFAYSANITKDGHTHGVWGYSTVDAPRDVSVPEPSSTALVLFGSVLLGADLFRRPSLRQRRGERHFRREPVVVRAIRLVFVEVIRFLVDRRLG